MLPSGRGGSLLPDKDSPLIHIPDDEPDFSGIAKGIEAEEPGDLGPSQPLGTDEPVRRRTRSDQSPTRAVLQYLQVDLPPALYPLFGAWEKRQLALNRALPEDLAIRYQQYIVGACGRDAAQDDIRPAGGQEYDFDAFIGKSFVQLLRDYGAATWDRDVRPALRDQRALLKARLAERLPDWGDDDLEEALGPTGEEG